MNDQASKLKGLAWLLGGIAFAALLALGISPLIRAIPWRWEQSLAERVDTEPMGGVCAGDAKKDALLQKLVKRLYPLDAADQAMPIDVQIVDDSDINAYAQLGGRITVNRGLLEAAQSPEEMAGVLAHEMEHVHRRHILEGVLTRLLTSQGIAMLTGDASSGAWGNYFLTMGFTRTQEAEADEGGLQRLQRAHIDNHGFQDFFERLSRESTVPAFLSDHPSSKSRFAKAKSYPNTDIKPVMTRKEWLVLQGYCR